MAEFFDVFASPRLVRFEEMEYALPRARAAEAVRACREILARHPVSFPIELRFSAGDDALLSPAHGRETRIRRGARVRGDGLQAPFREVEALLRGWDGRPHWGKRSFLGAGELASRYPRWGDFAAIRERLDPHGRFVNPWVARTLARRADPADRPPTLDPRGRLRLDRAAADRRGGAERRARGHRV